MGGRSTWWRGWVGLGVATSVLIAGGANPVRPPSAPPAAKPTVEEAIPQAMADDDLFRPTVIIRKGTGRGSGSVIASVKGDTLVLTAAHVVEGSGTLVVELHRYNLGFEHTRARKGWPWLVPAEVVARDADADVAVLRIRGIVALPFVAQLDDGADEPASGAVVTSVGVDRATDLSSWSAWVIEALRLDMDQGGGDRLFLLTSRAPELGRSGGGLFRQDGKLVGVCVGKVKLKGDRWIGLFTSGESVRKLLRKKGLEPAIARSNTLHLGRSLPRRAADNVSVTSTESRRPAKPAPKPAPAPRAR